MEENFYHSEGNGYVAVDFQLQDLVYNVQINFDLVDLKSY